ncbi:PKD domain-containing protein [Actinomadura spongiicola]|uniref:PKD domain-containing protein n=1 Tax=Actinomadura spongiicola TaxID=2303421 RepID=A0A372GBQ6_9ACTN|nr:PKD domain-containing protein [Actinomadura spongiicola]RFS82483.1 PKD domain-containing protein [Actinomadura spongiicola]
MRYVKPVFVIAMGVAMSVTAMAAPAAAEPLSDGAEWVALGDSYQAGTGTEEYTGDCHRSKWSHISLLDAEGSGPKPLAFVACEGATSHDLYRSMNGEPPQADAVLDNAGSIRVTTLGIGGNDLEFGPLITRCVTRHWVGRSCASAYDDQVQANFDRLVNTLDPATGLNRLQAVYTDLFHRAPLTRLITPTYAKFFPRRGGWRWWESGLLIKRCHAVRVSDQLWINNWIRRLDDAIIGSSQSVGAIPVDFYAASDGHELCNPDGNDNYLNGISLNPRYNSFHPTKFGYQVNANHLRPVIRQQLAAPPRRNTKVPTPLPKANTPPKARLTLTQHGDTIKVDASGSHDPDGEIVQYLWEFDDGTMDDGKSISHTYKKAGTYTVTLIVMDNEGEMGFATADVVRVK